MQSYGRESGQGSAHSTWRCLPPGAHLAAGEAHLRARYDDYVEVTRRTSFKGATRTLPEHDVQVGLGLHTDGIPVDGSATTVPLSARRIAL